MSKCAACPHAANADAARFGKLWCTECVGAIEFEERLARQNRLTVADVLVNPRGGFAVLLVGADGEEPSRDSVERATLTEAEVLRELSNALTSFTRNVILLGDRVIATGRDAVSAARHLLGVISKYKPLLGAQDRASCEQFQRIARMVAREVH